MMSTPGAVRNDAHLHLGFDADHGDDGGLTHFLSLMDHHRISRACVVTPSTHGFDNQVTTVALTTHPDRFVGIARLDLTTPGASDTLRSLLGQGCRGVRFAPRSPGDHGWLTADPLGEIAAILADHDAVACLHGGSADLPAAARFARTHPDLVILLDHGGRPDLRDPHHHEDPGLRELSELANVRLKTPNSSAFSLAPPPHRDLIPYHRRVLELFGADRVMWGSDWPVCLAGGDYGAALTAADIALTHASPAERALVLGGTFDQVFPHASPRQKECL